MTTRDACIYKGILSNSPDSAGKDDVGPYVAYSTYNKQRMEAIDVRDILTVLVSLYYCKINTAMQGSGRE